MNYTESKEQSAEILRAVLGTMGHHDAPFNPITFTLWYEHIAGTNQSLTQALEQALVTEPRLSNDTVKRLFSRHVAGVDHAEMERISGDFQRVMGGMAESAAKTGDSAGEYRDQLQGLSQALEAGDTTGATPYIKDVMLGTSKMELSAQALQTQVNASRNEIMRLQSELSRVRNEALLDPLTRILNRRGFDQELAAMMQSQPGPQGAHCLVMIDIDHFKKVNDTHGHVTGDRVIQALGEVLKQTVTDPAHAVARYGGEEFAVLMPNCQLDDCARMAETIRTRVKSMKVRNKKTQEVMLTVTVSLGLTCQADGDDAATLIARADAALYQSKQGGRDRVTKA
jgi:diguanylate cyclase